MSVSYGDSASEIVGIIMIAALAVFMYQYSKRIKS